jgi:hypothetical protein
VRVPIAVWRLASVIALMAPAPSLAQGAAGGANIVFILADDLGPGDLGSYGQRKIENAVARRARRAPGCASRSITRATPSARPRAGCC